MDKHEIKFLKAKGKRNHYGEEKVYGIRKKIFVNRNQTGSISQIYKKL